MKKTLAALAVIVCFGAIGAVTYVATTPVLAQTCGRC
jgi:hypothetical protein